MCKRENSHTPILRMFAGPQMRPAERRRGGQEGIVHRTEIVVCQIQNEQPVGQRGPGTAPTATTASAPSTRCGRVRCPARRSTSSSLRRRSRSRCRRSSGLSVARCSSTSLDISNVRRSFGVGINCSHLGCRKRGKLPEEFEPPRLHRLTQVALVIGEIRETAARSRTPAPETASAAPDRAEAAP